MHSNALRAIRPRRKLCLSLVVFKWFSSPPPTCASHSLRRRRLEHFPNLLMLFSRLSIERSSIKTFLFTPSRNGKIKIWKKTTRRENKKRMFWRFTISRECKQFLSCRLGAKENLLIEPQRDLMHFGSRHDSEHLNLRFELFSARPICYARLFRSGVGGIEARAWGWWIALHVTSPIISGSRTGCDEKSPLVLECVFGVGKMKNDETENIGRDVCKLNVFVRGGIERNTKTIVKGKQIVLARSFNIHLETNWTANWADYCAKRLRNSSAIEWCSRKLVCHWMSEHDFFDFIEFVEEWNECEVTLGWSNVLERRTSMTFHSSFPGKFPFCGSQGCS